MRFLCLINKWRHGGVSPHHFPLDHNYRFVNMKTLSLSDTSVTLHLQALRCIYLSLLNQQPRYVIVWIEYTLLNVMFHMPEIYGTSFHMPLYQYCMSVVTPMLRCLQGSSLTVHRYMKGSLNRDWAISWTMERRETACAERWSESPKIV